MAPTLYNFPLSGGVDQTQARYVGNPRINILNRARYIQDGQIIASPGYVYDTFGLLMTDTEHLVALGYSNLGGNWAVVSGNNSTIWSTNIVRRDPIHGWRSSSEWVSSAQAPRRHTIVTNALFNSTPHLLKTTDPSLVLVLSNNTWLTYWKDGKITKEMDFGVPSVPDRTKYYSAGYCFVGARGGVYKYNAALDSFSTPIIPGSATTLSVWSDPNFGLAGSGIQYCAVVLTTGEIAVYKWDGSTFSTLGVIPASDVPAISPVGLQAGLISCCFVNNLLIRFAGSGPVGVGAQISLYVQEYGLPGRVKQLASDVMIDSAYGGTPAQSISEIDGSGSGNLWVAFQVYDGAPGLVTTTVWTLNIAGTPTLNLVGAMPGRTLKGQLTRAPGETLTTTTQGVLVQCQYGPDSDPASELWSVSANGAQLLTTLHGNQFYWGSTGAMPSSNAYVAMKSGFDHQETCALLLAGQSRVSNTVAPGQGNNVRWANELVSIELGGLPGNPVTVPGLGVLSPGYQHSPIEAYQQAGGLVSGGLPVSIGNRLDSGGCLFTPPAPACTAVTGSGLGAGTYLYTMVLEIQDSEGRVLRSSPSAPTSVTTVSPNFQVNVVFQVSPLPPISGINTNTAQWIIYRTLANGTDFHRLGVMSANTYSDVTVDTDLQSASILYTQGSTSGISGIVPSYGVPPCRSLWRGRDRVIVGGLELPKRVRWSKLFYPGEGVSFPHPSSAQWWYDVDDDVTAVAQLDDAWIVFCKTRIYAIYGAGPDDSGSTASGQFEAPRCISMTYGCHSSRSLLELPEGLLFQAEDGQIYLLARGGLQIVWFSAKARNIFGNPLTGLQVSWVTACVTNERTNTIHFIRDTDCPVVYDRQVLSWTTDTDGVSVGLTGAVTGCTAEVPPTTSTLSTTTDTFTTIYIGTTSGKIIYENCGNGAASNPLTGPDGTVSWTPYLETSDLSLWGLGGWGAVDRIAVLFSAPQVATYPVKTQPRVTFFGFKSEMTSDSKTFPLTFTDATDCETGEFVPDRLVKCSSCRIRVEWFSAEALVGMSLMQEAKPGMERLPPTSRA